MKSQSLCLFLALFLGGIQNICAAESSSEPQVLIDEMSIASVSLNYDGVFVYTIGNQIDTLRIIHKSDDGDSYQRLISLTGHAREVVRNKDQVRCYFPENKSVIVEKSRLGELVSTYLPQPIELISDFYIFEMAGEDRIAGLDAWIINIKPIDTYRYGYQLWIDKESKLLLKSELKNKLGVTLEKIMFAQLSVLDNIDDALLKPSTVAEDFTWYKNATSEALETSVRDKKWRANWIPSGFSMSEQSKELMLTSRIPVEHLVYSDGLAMVSIYVEKLDKQPDIVVGASNFGGINTYAVYTNGYQVTAVGEVPKITVKLMADSVEPYQ